MNKDSIVGSFDKDESNVFETVYKEHDMDRSKTPYGYKTIDQWLESRKASKHNAHLKRIMAQYGCENTEGFLKLTHAASINDTFWVKNENETCTWDDISLYRNPFTEVVSRLAFEGVGIPDLKFSITSPELSSHHNQNYPWLTDEEMDVFAQYIKSVPVRALHETLAHYPENVRNKIQSMWSEQ
jgi:hypothetical protein